MEHLRQKWNSITGIVFNEYGIGHIANSKVEILWNIPLPQTMTLDSLQAVSAVSVVSNSLPRLCVQIVMSYAHYSLLKYEWKKKHNYLKRKMLSISTEYTSAPSLASIAANGWPTISLRLIMVTDLNISMHIVLRDIASTTEDNQNKISVTEMLSVHTCPACENQRAESGHRLQDARESWRSPAGCKVEYFSSVHSR